MSEEKTVRIVRHAVERDFTILRNKAIRDPMLTWKATGQLCYLLSLPADWRLRLSHLSKQKKDGRDSTRAGFKELEKAGYMWIETRRDEKGKFVETVWHVSDMPVWRGRGGGSEEENVENPRAENPNAGNPPAEIPTLQSTEQRSTDEYKNLNPHKERAEGQRPSGGRAKGPLSGGGGKKGYFLDEATGVCLQEGNEEDRLVLQEIKQFKPEQVLQAVRACMQKDARGRAYPSAVLRTLRRAAGRSSDGGAPAWLMLAGRGQHQPTPQEKDVTDYNFEDIENE